MPNDMRKVNATVHKIAVSFVGRAEAQGWKGKVRDRQAVEFFIGATSALQKTGHPDAGCLWTVTALLICTRGYSEVKKISRSTPLPSKSGPSRLVWNEIGNNEWQAGGLQHNYSAVLADDGTYSLRERIGDKPSRRIGNFPTLYAAKVKAQALLDKAA